MPTVSLVLGSGGARGLAHIGVIRELIDRGYDVGSVVGCSMGAVIGGCYCAGKLDDYEDWVSSLSEWDVLRLLDVSLIPRNGMMKGDLITDALRELVGAQRIEDLDLPFTAVATDLGKGKEVWLDRGDLFDAMRASMAMPGIFTPKKLAGRTLVDGGLLNPVPGAPATSDTTDLTIAVSLAGTPSESPYGPNPPSSDDDRRLDRYRKSIDDFIGGIQDKLGLESDESREKKQELGITGIMLEAFDAMQTTIARFRLAAYPPDVLIEIPRNTCKTYEFFKARELVHAGRYWASQVLERRDAGTDQ